MGVAATNPIRSTYLSRTGGTPTRELLTDSVPGFAKLDRKRTGGFYRPELDVVRFLAFLLVFLMHSLPSGPTPDSSTTGISKGIMAVLYGCQRVSVFGLSLFFTLSAYLICDLLLREREINGTVLVKQFYIRRILRIWPLYFAGLVLGLVFSVLLGGRQVTFVWTAWAAILLGNWFVVFHGIPGNLMFHLWSISVEEQFYLFAPWAAKALNRIAFSGFSIVLVICANIQLISLGNNHAPDHVIWYSSFVQFENFAAGILLCLLVRSRSAKLSIGMRLS